MISTTWTAAPAGSLGLGGSDARPYVFQGTAAPFGGMTCAARPRTADRQAFLQAPVVDVLGLEVHVQKPIAPTTGTTLGIPSSRRPAS
jgi:hypothetical protein